MNVILLLQLLILFFLISYLTAKREKLREIAVISIGLKFFNIYKYSKIGFFCNFFYGNEYNFTSLEEVRQVTCFLLKSN